MPQNAAYFVVRAYGETGTVAFWLAVTPGSMVSPYHVTAVSLYTRIMVYRHTTAGLRHRVWRFDTCPAYSAISRAAPVKGAGSLRCASPDPLSVCRRMRSPEISVAQFNLLNI